MVREHPSVRYLDHCRRRPLYSVLLPHQRRNDATLLLLLPRLCPLDGQRYTRPPIIIAHHDMEMLLSQQRISITVSGRAPELPLARRGKSQTSDQACRSGKACRDQPLGITPTTSSPGLRRSQHASTGYSTPRNSGIPCARHPPFRQGPGSCSQSAQTPSPNNPLAVSPQGLRPSPTSPSTPAPSAPPPSPASQLSTSAPPSSVSAPAPSARPRRPAPSFPRYYSPSDGVSSAARRRTRTAGRRSARRGL